MRSIIPSLESVTKFLQSIVNLCLIIMADCYLEPGLFKIDQTYNIMFKVSFMLLYVNQKHFRVAIDWQLFAVDCFKLGHYIA